MHVRQTKQRMALCLAGDTIGQLSLGSRLTQMAPGAEIPVTWASDKPVRFAARTIASWRAAWRDQAQANQHAR